MGAENVRTRRGKPTIQAALRALDAQREHERIREQVNAEFCMFVLRQFVTGESLVVGPLVVGDEPEYTVGLASAPDDEERDYDDGDYDNGDDDE